MPELQFHRHDRVKLSLALLAGLGIAIVIGQLAHPEQEPDSPPSEQGAIRKFH